MEPKLVADLKFNTSRPQAWRDWWRGGRERICRFVGRCVVCNRRTYAFDDGEDDPRGVLGDHAASPFVATDNGMTGPDVPACFLCQNEEHTYRYGLEVARKRWSEPVAAGVES